ncbi:hypothetical protein ACKWTF_006764 [Chironomus riparius]
MFQVFIACRIKCFNLQTTLILKKIHKFKPFTPIFITNQQCQSLHLMPTLKTKHTCHRNALNFSNIAIVILEALENLEMYSIKMCENDFTSHAYAILKSFLIPRNHANGFNFSR